LEAEWLDDLESTPRWLVFLASYMYSILFFLAAVLTILGFVRYRRRRKKIYAEWEEEDDDSW
jgi:cytochrome b561